MGHFPAYINNCKFLKALSAGRHIISFCVQHFEAESLKHTQPSVVGGTPANSYKKTSAALANGICNHFANAISRSDERIPFLIGNQRKTGRLGHFQNGGLTLLYDTVLTFYRISQRPCHSYLPESASQTLCQRIHRPLTAVSQRTHLYVCIRKSPPDTRRGRFSSLKR